MSLVVQILVSLVVVLLVRSSLAEIANTEVSQIFDASTSVVRYTGEIKATGVEGEYDLLFDNSWSQHLSYLTVSSKGKTLVVSAPVSNQNFTTYTIQTGNEGSISLKVQAVFTSILVPYPAEITQAENQLVRLDGNHYFLSPYKTVSQKTVYKLASSSIESYSKLSPSSVRGSTINFGPFKDIEPFSRSSMHIHYVNNFPFAKFSTVTREIEVSHWGNIAVEEIYELKHAGASLKGGFSRFDYQMKRGGSSPSFRNLVATLPSQATNIYYRDQIGNISTSDVRKTKDGDLELDIQTRFPIFGGWQTQFYVGYSIPTELALFVDTEGRFKLKFDFFTIFDDVWVEDMEIKVILPEGSTGITVNVPYEAEQSRTVRYTYLDSKFNGGRTVIVIKAKNLVEEHNDQVEISYEFPKNKIYVEPMMLVATFFGLFFIASFIARGTKIAQK